jgi:hypothetical protein
MSATDVLPLLWGATVTSYCFDLQHHRFGLVLEVVDNAVHTTYRLAMEGVKEFAFANRHAPDEAWDRVELTSVDAAQMAGAGPPLWRLEAEIWLARLTVVARTLSVQAA